VSVCSTCGAPLGAGAVAGQCPRCLIALGLDTPTAVSEGFAGAAARVGPGALSADAEPAAGSLGPGSRLGGYHLLSLVGRGGMGEVYRARDGRLGREVAIKLLPPQLGSRPEMLARFEREARVLASLNHPNIATLFGFEADGSNRFLVMELVEGETLQDRIERGPIAETDALAIFVAVARGLAAAHEKGVVHRDLKPSNIELAENGQIKVLDFGLAKASIDGSSASASHSMSPTLSVGATQAGALLGTAAYMSPEQAKGREVDRRTDVWSFGCCLFEALTGERAFDGDSVAEILANVLKEEPDWTRLDGVSSPGTIRLLRRCLVRDTARRPRDLGDLALEIEALMAHDAVPAAAASTSATMSCASS